MISKFILEHYVMPYMSIFGIEPSLKCAEDVFLNLIRKYLMNEYKFSKN